MRVAIRRALRVGKRSGVLLEDLGVAPDEVHEMTRSDVLEQNRDLIAHAGRMLKGMKPRSLVANTFAPVEQGISFMATTMGLNRLDVYLDDRPRDSFDLVDGANPLTIQTPYVTGTRIRLEGFSDGELTSVRRGRLPTPTA
jgi:hypothetical protein